MISQLVSRILSTIRGPQVIEEIIPLAEKTKREK